MFLDAQQLEKARERDAADAVADVAAAARVAARRRARDQSQRDVFDEDSYASSSESDDQASSDDENDQTIDPMATLRHRPIGAQDWSYISEAAMPSSSDRGWWGFDEYPLETLKRPLDLDLSDDEDVARPPTPARLSEEEDARRAERATIVRGYYTRKVCHQDWYAGWRTRASRTSTASRMLWRRCTRSGYLLHLNRRVVCLNHRTMTISRSSYTSPLLSRERPSRKL